MTYVCVCKRERCSVMVSSRVIFCSGPSAPGISLAPDHDEEVIPDKLTSPSSVQIVLEVIL